MNDWILPGTLSRGPLGTALRAASGDLWVLGWGMALLNLCSRGQLALTPHSVHIAINIKRHQKTSFLGHSTFQDFKKGSISGVHIFSFLGKGK